MPGSRSAETGPDALGDVLARIDGAQRAITRLLDAGAYDEAFDESAAMAQLAAALPGFSGTPAHTAHSAQLIALMAEQGRITARLRDALHVLQTARRQRHKAITAYTGL